jgi:hypothetical protein
VQGLYQHRVSRESKKPSDEERLRTGVKWFAN